MKYCSLGLYLKKKNSTINITVIIIYIFIQSWLFT